MGIQPLTDQLLAIAHRLDDGILAAYIDDIKTQASAALIEKIIDTQIRDGPAYGAFLKMEKHRILLEVCATDDAAASALQSHFHTKYAIPCNRILIHPANIADPVSKVEGRLLYGDVILEIPASPFPEFISAFVQAEILRISMVWRLASDRLKDEPYHLWYLLRPILGSKFTHLFRGIAPEFLQPLAEFLMQLHRETCEILAQSETIPDLSFDLARIKEGAGLGFADDIPDCAFAASKIACLRSIENANPGYLESVEQVLHDTTNSLHDPDILLPARQLAAALLAVEPSFSTETYSNQDYPELRKLQGKFLLPRKSARTAAVESRLRSNNMFHTIYQSGKSIEARAWLDAIPKSEAQTMLPNCLPEPTTHSPSSAPRPSYDLILRQNS